MHATAGHWDDLCSISKGDCCTTLARLRSTINITGRSTSLSTKMTAWRFVLGWSWCVELSTQWHQSLEIFTPVVAIYVGRFSGLCYCYSCNLYCCSLGYQPHAFVLSKKSCRDSHAYWSTHSRGIHENHPALSCSISYFNIIILSAS